MFRKTQISPPALFRHIYGRLIGFADILYDSVESFVVFVIGTICLGEQSIGSDFEYGMYEEEAWKQQQQQWQLIDSASSSYSMALLQLNQSFQLGSESEIGSFFILCPADT